MSNNSVPASTADTVGIAVAALELTDSSSWWRDIDESPVWQDRIFYTLAVLYGAVSAIALIQLVRIQLRVPEYGWTTQKVFHFLNFLVNAVRCLVFIFFRSVQRLQPEIVQHILLDVPSLAFFTTYALLVLFWAEIYYQARAVSTDGLKPSFYTINIVVYVVQCCQIVVVADCGGGIVDNRYDQFVKDGGLMPFYSGFLAFCHGLQLIKLFLSNIVLWLVLWWKPVSVLVILSKVFFAGVSLFAALGFLLYGGRLFLMLQRFPVESKGRRKKLQEVGYVTTICFLCFLIRCIMMCFNAFDKHADLNVMDHPILNFIYYLLAEILPSSLVLFILRKLPPKRGITQYHPIR